LDSKWLRILMPSWEEMFQQIRFPLPEQMSLSTNQVPEQMSLSTNQVTDGLGYYDDGEEPLGDEEASW
jgi:hypothetical protein